MTWLCPRPCGNKTADGYCGTSWCINPMYSNIGSANEKLMGGLRKTTNADRIRAMTDEEMAAYMGDVQTWGGCPNHGARNCTENCADCWLDWLKQEVGDDA